MTPSRHLHFPAAPYHAFPYDPRMYTGYYLPQGAAIPMPLRYPTSPQVTGHWNFAPNPIAGVAGASSPMQIPQNNATPQVKRKHNGALTTASKRLRFSNENPDALNDTHTSFITYAPGIGPATSPLRLPPSIPMPIASRNPNQSSEKKNIPSKQAASDVWYFMLPVDSRERPSELPSVSASQVKPKSDYVACSLCPFPEKWSIWTNMNGIADTIRTHLSKHHCDEWKKKVFSAKLKGWEKIEKTEFNPAYKPKVSFTREGFLQRLARWITADDQSINVIECKELRELILYLNSDLDDSDIPHRTKLTEYIFNNYKVEWDKLLDALQKSEGRISSTSDLWTDPNLRAFMAHTVHYCAHDQNGALRIFSRLAAFRYISGAHNGVNLAENYIKILKDLGILHKLGMITLDNASNCDTMMVHLQKLLKEHGISFCAEGNRIRCFPHVINISVQTALKELSKPTASTLVEEIATPSCPPSVPMAVSPYELTLASDPISKCRKLVTACRASGGRREDLQLIIQDGNKSKSFPDQQQIRPVQLLRDVDTRWSSTYLMIERVLELYPAVEVLLNKVKYKDIHKHLLSDMDRKVLGDILLFLELPHSVQSLLCGEKAPTLSLVLPAYEELLETLKLFRVKYPQLNHAVLTTISKIEEYVYKSRKNRVYALATIINPATKLSWIEDHWTASEAKDAKAWMLEMMFEFRKAERKGASDSAFTCSKSLLSQGSSEPGVSRIRALKSKLQGSSSDVADNSQPATSSSSESTKSIHPRTEAQRQAEEQIADEKDRVAVAEELQRYISEGLVNDLQFKSDSLAWHWQQTKRRFPTMYRVALDVLPIQASSVACERAFSSSKETITMRRSCLSTSLMEVLQFLKFTYREERLNLTEGLITTEDELTHEDLPDASETQEAASEHIDELINLLNAGCT